LLGLSVHAVEARDVEVEHLQKTMFEDDGDVKYFYNNMGTI